jgi:ABC-type transport system involved in multi-copper enzyme maturation permease subunit
MGLTPIEYRAWKGQRTEHTKRFLVIADSILRHSLRSKWFLAVLIIGTFLTFALPTIFLSISPHEALTAETMVDALGNGLYFIFIIILASMLCSDLLAEDTRSNSLVLYLSRALRPEGYLLGKFSGAFLTLALFAMLPALIMAVAITATQSGQDYVSSVEVIGETLIATAWTTLFLIPIGLMVSSVTRRKTYAAVGTFMTIFVLEIVAGIFAQYDANWELVSPGNVLAFSYDIIFGLELPSHVNEGLLLAAAMVMTIPPIVFVYYQITRRGVGK